MARNLLPIELGATLEFQRVPLAQAVGQAFLSPKDFGDPGVLTNSWRDCPVRLGLES